MLADAPYDNDSLVLTPAAGAVAGAAAAMAMVVVVGLEVFGGSGWRAGFGAIGESVLPWSAGATSLAVVGTVFHLAVGALLGLLYAACQQRAPLRGLVAVALFYGVVVCWAIVGRISGWALGSPLRGVVRSWGWLFACLTYGLLLAAVAWTASRRAHDTVAVPID